MTVKNVSLSLLVRKVHTVRTQRLLSARRAQQDGVASRLLLPVNHVTKASSTQRTAAFVQSVLSTRIKISLRKKVLRAKDVPLVFIKKERESHRAKTMGGRKPQTAKTMNI